ncbi:MAG: TonB-dependent receptor plug domain-containing protein [Pseudomonadales bacterium]|nr:TonB-dependent receptor plug domain-containing protein [Pseudomonadales bacterium]
MKRERINRAVLAVLTLLTGGFLAVSSYAEQAIEEVVVTAQKKSESLQDVPLAITAFSGDYLDNLGIENLKDLQHYAPSLTFTSGNSVRNSALAVRGIGSSG